MVDEALTLFIEFAKDRLALIAVPTLLLPVCFVLTLPFHNRYRGWRTLSTPNALHIQLHCERWDRYLWLLRGASGTLLAVSFAEYVLVYKIGFNTVVNPQGAFYFELFAHLGWITAKVGFVLMAFASLRDLQKAGIRSHPMPPSGFNEKAVTALVQFLEACYQDLRTKIQNKGNTPEAVDDAITQELTELRDFLNSFNTNPSPPSDPP